MESEALFAEEAEPPGRLTGIVGPNPYEDYSSFLGTPSPPPVMPAPPASRQDAREEGRIRAFRRLFFPNTTLKQWQDWRWQLHNRIRDVESLGRIIRLSEDERHAMTDQAHAMPLAITPHYASLLDPWNPGQALRRTVVPTVHEHFRSSGESNDPLHEDEDSPVPGIVHRYPDRVLFLVTGNCATYCRYCTRSRMVGHDSNHCLNITSWKAALSYIASHPEIRDVLLSGGDPLTLADEPLEWILSNLRRMDHIEMIRIGTKAPMVLPQRITPALLKMLRRYHPLWISIHATHPDELTSEAAMACARLADAGIPLGSQTVLLSGINDDTATMKRLVHGLLKVRVKPYYLYQCDPIPGSSHFRTPVSRGLEIIRRLRGFTTGYAVPTYVIDAPGGGGKIPLLPDYVVGLENGDLILKNYEGQIFRYPDCPSEESVIH
ncbi:MAG: KamA family radical SAM protein [Thermodesulfobacteriota bacterium]